MPLVNKYCWTISLIIRIYIIKREIKSAHNESQLFQHTHTHTDSDNTCIISVISLGVVYWIIMGIICRFTASNHYAYNVVLFPLHIFS